MLTNVKGVSGEGCLSDLSDLPLGDSRPGHWLRCRVRQQRGAGRPVPGSQQHAVCSLWLICQCVVLLRWKGWCTGLARRM